MIKTRIYALLPNIAAVRGGGIHNFVENNSYLGYGVLD